MEASPFCRLCSETIVDQCVNIYDEEGQRDKVSEIIVQHFGIEIPPNDGYSTTICNSCWTITANFHCLYETVQLAEANLSNYECPAAGDSPDELDDAIEEYAEYKIEDDALLVANDDNAKTPIDNTFQTSYVQCKLEMADEDVVMANHSTDDDHDLAAAPAACSSAQASPRLKPPKADRDTQERQTRIEREDKQIRDFFRMHCELCELTFETLNEATLHYRRQHQQAGYLVCCEKKFFRRCMALDHINQHMNPSALQCEKCGKSFTSRFSLQTHLLEHDPEVLKAYHCDVCVLTFAKQFQLSQHMRTRHAASDKKTFGCDICGKFFVTKHVLSTHIRGVHENAFAHMCHICAKTFKSKQVFELHQREHLDHEIPKLQCNICGAWLKHEHSLRKHMSRHADTAEVCKLCNKVAPNKHALGNHMRYVHSERSYKCTMCDKAFKKPIGLKEHMASHTGIDLYTCPYCPRTFKSGANMHSHRKKKHLEQWTQDRHQRFNTSLLYPAPKLE